MMLKQAVDQHLARNNLKGDNNTNKTTAYMKSCAFLLIIDITTRMLQSFIMMHKVFEHFSLKKLNEEKG
jgi:hypothetical protein